MAEDQPLGIAHVMLGTAGHIDHGKSSLVKALTGIDPDRLPEEQEKELTIDLGFAPLRLPDGRLVGMIDVPGHERFVKNMVAGATSLDIALLVIDANEGVMPQTREHLEILELLLVPRLLVTLTKIDSAGEEMAALAAETVREALAPTPFREAPIFPVSAHTREGLDALVEGIALAVATVRPRRPSGPFRMPIQRVFSAKGFGTVLTGVPVSGRIRPGDAVAVEPGGRLGRVRRIQAYRHEAPEASAGHSAALNVADLDYKDIHRGMVCAEPGAFQGATLIEASLRHLRSSPRPLAHLEEVRVHTGTVEALGQVAILSGKALPPGDEGPIQLRLREPVVVAPGDRFILRRHAEARTIGGGEVLGVSRFRLKSDRGFVLEALDRKRQALGDPARIVEESLRLAGTDPLAVDDLRVQSGLGEAEVRAILDGLIRAGAAAALRHGGLHVHRDGLAAAERRTLDAVDAMYEREPLRVHVERLEVREATRLHAEVFEAALDALVLARRLERLDPQRLRKAGRRVSLTAEQEARRARILAAFERDPAKPPDEDELAQLLGLAKGGAKEVRMLLGVLVGEGVLVHLGAGLHLLVDALERARGVVRELGEGGRELSASEFRERFGTSRKFAIPLLEHLDREGLTERVGPNRRLRG